MQRLLCFSFPLGRTGLGIREREQQSRLKCLRSPIKNYCFEYPIITNHDGKLIMEAPWSHMEHGNPAAKP